jgi:hypothetical protein
MEKDICWSKKILYAHNSYSQVRRNCYQKYDVILITLYQVLVTVFGSGFSILAEYRSGSMALMTKNFKKFTAEKSLQFPYP